MTMRLWCLPFFAAALVDAAGLQESSCADAQCISPDGSTASSLAQRLRSKAAAQELLHESMDPNSGAWNQFEGEHGHIFSTCLGKAMVSFAQSRGITNALDLGAGTGHYSSAMVSSGVETSCYDGNPETQGISAQLCKPLDLSISQIEAAPSMLQGDSATPPKPKPAELVWSFEVGEHIPRQREQAFIENLAFFASKYLVLSWAVPDQPGLGHVNGRDNAYIVQELGKRGFVHDAVASANLREKATAAGCCCGWFKNTLMAFNKTKAR